MLNHSSQKSERLDFADLVMEPHLQSLPDPNLVLDGRGRHKKKKMTTKKNQEAQAVASEGFLAARRYYHESASASASSSWA